MARGSEHILRLVESNRCSRYLYRATLDFIVVPDDNLSTGIDGENDDQLHLVASAMPRSAAY